MNRNKPATQASFTTAEVATRFGAKYEQMYVQTRANCEYLLMTIFLILCNVLFIIIYSVVEL